MILLGPFVSRSDIMVAGYISYWLLVKGKDVGVGGCDCHVG